MNVTWHSPEQLVLAGSGNALVHSIHVHVIDGSLANDLVGEAERRLGRLEERERRGEEEIWREGGREGGREGERDGNNISCVQCVWGVGQESPPTFSSFLKKMDLSAPQLSNWRLSLAAGGRQESKGHDRCQTVSYRQHRLAALVHVLVSFSSICLVYSFQHMLKHMYMYVCYCYMS